LLGEDFAAPALTAPLDSHRASGFAALAFSGLKTPVNSDPSSVLAERMLREGRISPALANAALDRHNNAGERFEEALIECGLPESMLLRHLAEMFGTKFISTKTLQGVVVPRGALQRLSQRLAERYQVVPLRFAEDETLTVVAGDLSSSELLESVRVAAGARQVKGLVARPSAVQAAIAKLYRGDGAAFGRIGRLEDGDGSRQSAPPPMSPGSRASLEDGFQELPVDTSAFDSQFPAAPAQQYPAAFAAPQYPAAPAFEGPPSSQLPAALGGNLPAPVNASSWLPSSEPLPELDESVSRIRSAALGDPSRLAESLMVIHERSRGSLKSHSARVARLNYSLCRQLDLSEPQAAHAWAIGLFHDLGKTQQHHLTALNVWQLRDHEVLARAQYQNPGRLLEKADVPDTVKTAILHMYERFDGQGFPEGLAGEAIPFQSRVLALCDSITDLTLNPGNTLGRIVSPLEACNHIRAQTPKVFDPTLLAHFSRLLVERKLDGAFLSDQSVHGIEKLLG
jgi:HD-GYP domain-containing protein (c-di-GMP phosphodiesterase class II)